MKPLFLIMLTTCLTLGGESQSHRTPQYLSRTGHIHRREPLGQKPEYFVTVVSEPDRPPWLVVVKPNVAGVRVKQTSSSSSSVSSPVTIDGVGYTEVPGRTIVVYESMKQEFDTQSEEVFLALRGSWNDVDAADLDLILTNAAEEASAESEDSTDRTGRN